MITRRGSMGWARRKDHEWPIGPDTLKGAYQRGAYTGGKRGAASAHPLTVRAVGSQGLAAVQILQKPFVSASLLASYKTCRNWDEAAACRSSRKFFVQMHHLAAATPRRVVP